MKTNRCIAAVIILIMAIFPLALINIYPAHMYVGSHAGECMGVCTTRFDYTSHQLIIDEVSNDSMPGEHKVISGNFDSLKFGVPILLLTHLSNEFGDPDADDGGALDFGFSFFGMNFNYSIEHKNDAPWYFGNMTGIVYDRLAKIYRIDSLQHK